MKSRKILIRLSIISALCAVLTVSAFAREKSALFADVYSDDWYAPAAEYCYRNYIMYPDPDLNFNANLPVSRAGVVDALYNTLPHQPTITNHHNFPDVAILNESWDHQAALDPEGLNRSVLQTVLDWATLEGIATGYPDGGFHPLEPVSRQQLAAFLWRMNGKPAAPDCEPFTDDAAIASYAREAVYWAKSEGYLNGRADGSFNPDGTATRAHLAQVMMNYDSKPEISGVYGYALLYADGTLVFQKDDAPEAGRELRETYPLERSYVGNTMPWQASGFKKAVFRDKIQHVEAAHWFDRCRELETVENLSNLDLSRVTSASYMFGSCISLTGLDMSGFDTSHVEDMIWMFYGCENLKELNLNGLDTSNVTNMRGMFYDCKSLTGLDLSPLNTGRVTIMKDMFTGCTNLTEINLSGIDTSHVTNMEEMFTSCESLTNVDLSGFDTSAVTEMSLMFSGCKSLQTLDLSGFDVQNVIRMTSMFYNCANLTTIWVSDKSLPTETVGSGYRPVITWSTGFQTEQGIPNWTGMMFSGCVSLVGGAGTRYDESHTDGSYARIDGGPDAPGYFTRKN